MTLTTWLRDYVVRAIAGPSRPGIVRRSTMALVITGLVGLWHGAQWTFVVWGLANGLSIVVYLLLRARLLARLPDAWRRTVVWRLGSWTCSTVVRVLISVLFFAPTFGLAAVFYDRLLVSASLDGFTNKIVLGGFLLFFAFWAFHYVQSTRHLGAAFSRCAPAVRGSSYAVGLLLLLFAARPTGEAFIYYQF